MKINFTIALFAVVTGLSFGAISPAYPPDNAALLYNKAVVEFDADEELNEKILKAATGDIEIDEELAKKINDYDQVIEYVIIAGKIKNCDWGIDYSKGLMAEHPDLLKIRNLGRLLVAKSRLLCKEGNYEQAINLCVTTEKYASDVCIITPVLTVLIGDHISCINDELITHILGAMPQKNRILLRIKSIVANFEDRLIRTKVGFEGERRLVAAHLDYNSEVRLTYEIFFDEFEDISNGIGVRRIFDDIERKLNKGDKEFFDVSLDYWNKTLDSVIAFTDLPYEKAYRALRTKLFFLFVNYPKKTEASLVEILCVNFQKIYSRAVKNQSSLNALRTAIKIYLIRANTGGLPGRLPAGCPKDPFSGKDFVYEKTADGFVLKCQGKDLGKDTVHEYVFKVKK